MSPTRIICPGGCGFLIVYCACDREHALSKPRIVCAANRHKDDPSIIVTGARHFDTLMRNQIKMTEHSHHDFHEQGFIDQHCNFYTREVAWIIAWGQGQLDAERVARRGSNLMESDTGTLYSEDLY